MTIMEFALNMINNNPDIAKNNPRAAGMINAIKSGDQAKGEEIAMNLCRTYGASKEEAISQAKAFFGI